MAFNGEDENSLLVRLEGLAQGMFGATDTAQRDAATKALVGFTSSRECLPQCRFLLERSRSQFALLLAAQSLVKTVTDFWNSFTAEDSLELSKFVLNYLAQGILEMPQVIVPYLVQVVCRVAKLGWLTDPSHKEIVQQIGSLLSMGTGNKSTAHYLLGLSLFTELVQELNTQLNSQTVMQHRKAAVSFRDLSLLDIFQTSINTLVQITEKTFPSDNRKKLYVLIFLKFLNSQRYFETKNCVS
jgi:exportin-7